MPELNPPADVMPFGNVGTPSRIFLELIKQCKLPPKVIGKLGLTFPKSGSKRYGRVPYQYKTTRHRTSADDAQVQEEQTDSEVKSASGVRLQNSEEYQEQQQKGESKSETSENETTEESQQHEVIEFFL